MGALQASTGLSGVWQILGVHRPKRVFKVLTTGQRDGTLSQVSSRAWSAAWSHTCPPSTCPVLMVDQRVQ